MIEYKLSLASSGAVKAPGYEDMLRFGYNKNCGVYRLRVTVADEWKGMKLRVFWHALNDLPVSTVDKNTIALLAADLMAQAEQEGVKNGVEAYTNFTHDMTPEKFAELVKSVKRRFHTVLSNL